MTRPRRTLRHGAGHIRPEPNGRWRAEICGNGQRYRQRCDTVEEARLFIDAMAEEIRSPAPLTAGQIADARNALTLLPEGVTLTQAAERYRQQHAALDPITCLEAYHRHVRDKERASLAPRSTRAIESYVGRFAAAHAKLPVHSITTADVAAWLDALHLAPITRSNHRRYLSGWFRWCIRAGHASIDPTTGVTVPRVVENTHGILTPAQLRTLLEGADRYDPTLTAYLALGAWCGVRSAELERMTLAAVDIPRLRVHVGAAVAKLRQQRYVPLPACAVAWLTRCGPIPGTIGHQAHERLQRLRAALQRDTGRPIDWPHNCLRNSFASYHLALHNDAALTATTMGNSPAIVYRYYRDLVTPEQAQEWFQDPAD